MTAQDPPDSDGTRMHAVYVHWSSAKDLGTLGKRSSWIMAIIYGLWLAGLPDPLQQRMEAARERRFAETDRTTITWPSCRAGFRGWRIIDDEEVEVGVAATGYDISTMSTRDWTDPTPESVLLSPKGHP